MKYMFLIYADESRVISSDELVELKARHAEVIRDATAQGILDRAEPLKSTRFATTVRKENGKRVVTDGPFAESKEQLVGYYILDLPSLEEAVQWAERIPAGPQGSEVAVEIRPLPGPIRID